MVRLLKKYRNAGKLCFVFLLLSSYFGAQAQPGSCQCSQEGYVYAGPDCETIDPMDVDIYCVPGDIPVDTNIYLLVIVALVYLAWLGRNYYKSDLYKSK